VDIDEHPEIAGRYHIDAVPSDVIIGGPRPLHEACYNIDDYEAFWRGATEKPDKAALAKKAAPKGAPAKKAAPPPKKPAPKKPEKTKKEKKKDKKEKKKIEKKKEKKEKKKGKH
jgi:hypothetical protein